MFINHAHPDNTEGRDFVVGDLHGCYSALLTKLDELNFNRTTDRLFSVGDLVDRGDENLKCLALYFEPWFYPVRGNHEQFMIESVCHGYNLPLWYRNGGGWYSDLTQVEQDNVKATCMDMKDNLPHTITIDKGGRKVGIVHAEPPPVWLVNMKEENLLWARTRIQYNMPVTVEGVDVVYVGHTPMKYPADLGNVRYIDTGAVFADGYLTVEEI